MLRLNQQQRTDLSSTLRELANLIFAAFVVGQFLAETPMSWWLFAAGLLLWTVCVGGALVLSGVE
jgi:hypothetical protein